MPDPDYVSCAVEVLKIAADALTTSAERLEPRQLERAIQLLANCRGKWSWLV